MVPDLAYVPLFIPKLSLMGAWILPCGDYLAGLVTNRYEHIVGRGTSSDLDHPFRDGVMNI
jgi:hypothetical protein